MKVFRYLLANFIDEFNAAGREKRIKMVRRFPFPEVKDRRHAAYVASTIEELCVRKNISIPRWVQDKKYFLKKPYFIGGLESLKAFLLVESPLSFRRRNIFVSQNVLNRV